MESNDKNNPPKDDPKPSKQEIERPTSEKPKETFSDKGKGTEKR